jgi:hypothetical protein
MRNRVAIIDTPLRHDVSVQYRVNNIVGLNSYVPGCAHSLHGSIVLSEFMESSDCSRLDVDYYAALDSHGKCTAMDLLEVLQDISLINYDLVLMSLALNVDSALSCFDKALCNIEGSGALIICSAFNDKATIGTLAKSSHTVGVVHHPNITKGKYKYLSAPKRLYFTNCVGLRVKLLDEVMEESGTSFYVPKLGALAINSDDIRRKLSVQ